MTEFFQLPTNIQSQTLLVRRLESELEIEKRHLEHQISKLYSDSNANQKQTPSHVTYPRHDRKRKHEVTQDTTMFINTRAPQLKGGCWPNDPRLTKTYQSKFYNGTDSSPPQSPIENRQRQLWHERTSAKHNRDDDGPLEEGEIETSY